MEPNNDENLEESESKFQSFVQEAPELLALINNLTSHLEDPSATSQIERITTILDKYQEQPQLLDPHLESIITPLMSLARGNFSNMNSLSKICKIIYTLTKVRGYKTVEKFFPHEVTDFEATLNLLQAQDPNDYHTWETRYVLLLWLSIIVLIPFQLSTLDSDLEGRETIFDKILALAKAYLRDPGKTRDAAAVLCARSLTRPDFSSKQLVQFLDWALSLLSSEETDTFLITGALQALSGIFKRGSRKELLDKAPALYERIKTVKVNSATHRKLFVKLVQRIGLTFLKPRIAPWRYQRGSRSLVDNLKKKEQTAAEHKEEEEEAEEEIAEEIEDIVQQMLDGLRDKDTIVRWSSAKGIGRITGRLSRDFGDQVVESILELFSIGEGDGAWHGGCLALGELARRGLLLPKRLDGVVPLILKALLYDERRGSHSIGSHVRDAACYVCWAFARAYRPEVMSDHVKSLAVGLMITALFDREINCRRAAAAAFQENVGRQGNFPHGIDIITTADYYSVAIRPDSYSKVSVKIAIYEEYRYAFIDHLVDVKLSHWERSLRELVSKALAALTPSDPQYIHDKILPKLIAGCLSDDLNVRHGSILAVAEVTLALTNASFEISPQRQQEIVAIVPDIEAARLYRGKGGEIIRLAVCRLIETTALSKLPVTGKTSQGPQTGIKKVERTIAFILQDTLDENLKHPNEDIQAAAVASLKAFCRNCYSFPPKKSAIDLVSKYLTLVNKEENAAVRRGITLALGVLPREFIIAADKIDETINTLVRATKIEDEANKRDAETRRNAVKGLSNLADNLGTDALTPERAQLVFKALLNSLCDYAVDNRGDVGSWVRKASMVALERLTMALVKHDQEKEGKSVYFTQEMCKTLMCLLAQNAMEKIDRTRERAGSTFERLLRSSVPFIPHQAEILQLIPKDLNWAASEVTFPFMIKLLEFDIYRNSVIVGVTASIAGITQSLVLDGSNVLLDYLKSLKESKNLDLLYKVAMSFVEILKANTRVDRVIIPLFKVITQMLANNIFDAFTPDKYPWAEELLKQVRQEILKSKEIVKIMASSYLFCWMLLYEDPIRQLAYQVLLSLLSHRYPKVRRITADELYIRVMTDEFLVPATAFDEILTLLSVTKWDHEITDQVKSSRDSLFTLLNISKLDLLESSFQ